MLRGKVWGEVHSLKEKGVNAGGRGGVVDIKLFNNLKKTLPKSLSL
jgi:hypothetical protein